METLFRWLAKMLAGILENYADPELQANLDAFNTRVAAQEAERDRFLEMIEGGNRVNAQLNEIIRANNGERQRLDAEIEQSKKDLAAKNALVLADPDDDIERVLPGAG